MLISWKKIILQVTIILLLFAVQRLVKRAFRRHKHYWWGWTLVFGLLAGYNFGIYWTAYPVALWMIWALLLILLQTVHNHEFIYRRYWPVFWRLSAFYMGIVFVISLFSNALPLV